MGNIKLNPKHLYFNPIVSNIRLVRLGYCLQEAENWGFISAVMDIAIFLEILFPCDIISKKAAVLSMSGYGKQDKASITKDLFYANKLLLGVLTRRE